MEENYHLSGFWKPGAPGPGLPPMAREEDAKPIIFNSNVSRSIQAQRLNLPIFRRKIELLYLLENYPTVIVVGATGCGKSTQIPQYLHEMGWTNSNFSVCCTQPRRVAATAVAERVAVEMGCRLGEEVGYSIRFDDSTSEDKTKIKFLTDGMLIREMMSDPLLSKYSVVMVDEAHERSVNTDMLLGLLKKIQIRRKDLRLIISSATVDALEFQKFFNDNRETLKSVIKTNWINPEIEENAAILSIEGRLFPVESFYTTAPISDYIAYSLEAVFDIHKNFPLGANQDGQNTNLGGDDILVFLTGQEEIDDLVRRITERTLRLEQENARNFDPITALPMYSGLSSEAQQKVFMSRLGVRKVIVSTNICETSVTIEGIGYVIDSGFMKIRTFDPKSGEEKLVVVPISKSSANQRAGRAGRTGPGKCFRLYTEASFADLDDKMIPEIQRTNLAPCILQLKVLGIDNLMRFDFLTPPPSALVASALETLYAVGALDASSKLTEPLGIAMAEVPLDPPLARALIAASQLGCLDAILSISAVLSVPSIFIQPRGLERKADTLRRKFAVKEGDHLTLLNIFNAFVDNNYNSKWCHTHYFNFRSLIKAVDVRKQLKRTFRRLATVLEKNGAKAISMLSESNSTDHITIRKCLLYGFFTNVAHLQPDGSYKKINGDSSFSLHPSSILCSYPPEWVMFNEVVHTTREYMHDISQIEASWLLEVAPHYYKLNT
jgi:ATP-dependent RNA helicase DDX35